jgi:hypothetical protein
MGLLAWRPPFPETLRGKEAMTNRFWSCTNIYPYDRPCCEAAGHFQTVMNSGLRLQTSDSEHERERCNSCFIIHSSFVIRASSFVCMSFAASPRFRSSDRPNVRVQWPAKPVRGNDGLEVSIVRRYSIFFPLNSSKSFLCDFKENSSFLASYSLIH